jgi:hypothetical protein
VHGDAFGEHLDGHAARFRDRTLDIPLTLQLAESLRVDVNVGRDWIHDGASHARGGIAVLEWQATPAWALIGERFRQLGGDFARIGVHWQPGDAIGFDLSRARGLGAASTAGWAIGVSRVFTGPLAASGAHS